MDEQQTFSLTDKAKVFGAGMVPVAIIDIASKGGGLGLVVGGAAAFILAKYSDQVFGQMRASLPIAASTHARPTGERNMLDRLIGRHYPSEEVSSEEEHDFVSADQQPTDVPGIPRYGVEQIIRHTVRNCFKAYIGRSLTQAGNPAVLISFYKRHIKLIGASQKGKSSMAAGLLEIILATHDTDRVLVALLDMEDMTSKLFAGDPHIAHVRTDGKTTPLHARSREQVLEHLELILQIMEHRYTMSKTAIALQPLLIVYLEEFLALKNYFKQRARGAKGAQKEQAVYDYERLVFCITEIARLGLKVRVQFLMCAQVDYRDEDLQEALVNVSSGMCFCVRATAASAAGFYQTEMLNRNAKENRVGQAVVEMPDCTDLVLAPEFDLEARLIALEEQENRAVPVYRDPAHGNAETPAYTPVNDAVNGATGSLETLPQKERLRLLGNAETPEVEHSEAEEASVNVNAETRKLIQRMLDMKVYKHREISKIVGLDGRKYPIYQQVCREMDIATEREA